MGTFTLDLGNEAINGSINAIGGWIEPGGLILSNNSGSITDTIDISAGACANSDKDGIITLTYAISKDVSSSWVAGDGNGGLDSTSSWGTNKTYHCHIIYNPSTDTADVFFSEDLVPTLPTGYTKRRHIGSITTNSSTEIREFTTADGSYYVYAEKEDIVNLTSSIPTTSTPYSVPVPSGYPVTPLLGAGLLADNTDNQRITAVPYVNESLAAEAVLLNSIFYNPVPNLKMPYNLLYGDTNSSAQLAFKGLKSTAAEWIVNCSGYKRDRETLS